MIEIKGKLIALKKDGTLVVFDNRKEYDNYDFKKEKVSQVFASPRWLKESLDGANATVDALHKIIEDAERDHGIDIDHNW